MMQVYLLKTRSWLCLCVSISTAIEYMYQILQIQTSSYFDLGRPHSWSLSFGHGQELSHFAL